MTRRVLSRARRAPTWGLLLVLGAAAVLVLAVAFLHQRTQAAEGAADAASYTPPPLATPNAVPEVRDEPGVTVIGDDLSTGPGGTSNALWTTLIQRELAVPVSTLATVGSGYTTTPDYGASRTFVDAARLAVPQSSAVVFFGGANDAGVPALTLIKAATDSIDDARTVAPDAQIFVVGPVWPTASPPASVLAVRDSLRTAADAADVTWVDPIQQRWLSRTGDLLSADGVTLTDDGQAVVANRLRSILATVVR